MSNKPSLDAHLLPLNVYSLNKKAHNKNPSLSQTKSYSNAHTFKQKGLQTREKPAEIFGTGYINK